MFTVSPLWAARPVMFWVVAYWFSKVSIWVWISVSVGSMSALESGSADTSSGKVT